MSRKPSEDRDSFFGDDESPELASSSFGNFASRTSRSKKSSSKINNSNFGMDEEDDDNNDLDSQNLSSGSDYMRKRGRGRGGKRGRRPGSKKSSIRQQEDDIDQDLSDMPSFSQESSSKSKKSSSRKKQDIFMQSESDEQLGINSASVFQDEDEVQMKSSNKKGRGSKKQGSQKDSQNEQSDQSVRLQKQEMMSGLQNQSNSLSKKSIFMDDSDSGQYNSPIRPEPGSEYGKIKKQDNQLRQAIKLEDGRDGQSATAVKKWNKQNEEYLKLAEQVTKDLKEKNAKIKKYASDFSEYKSRRVKKYIDGKLDLNVRYLHELVYDCYVQGLICEQLMHSIKHMGLSNSLEFVQKYEEQRLIQYDFKKVKFTIFDHRRLCKLLKQKGTINKYTDEKPLYFMPYELYSFISKVYQMPEDTYDAFCVSIDEAYQLNWWKTIGTQLKGKQPHQQIEPEPAPLPAPKKKNTTKRIRYKAKITEQKNKDQIVEEKKINNKDTENQKIKIDEFCLRKDDQMEISHSQIQLADSSLLNSNNKKSRPDKSSIYSSSIFETQQVLDSSFSMDSNTHSLEDVSDLLHEFSMSEKQHQKKSKNIKAVLEEKQMQKVKKGSVNLKKIQQKFKNKSKVKEEEQKPKVVPKKERKRQKKENKIEQKKKSKQKKQKLGKNKKSFREEDDSDVPEQDIQDSSYDSDDI